MSHRGAAVVAGRRREEGAEVLAAKVGQCDEVGMVRRQLAMDHLAELPTLDRHLEESERRGTAAVASTGAPAPSRCRENAEVDSALGKGLRVLELLASAPAPARLSQIAADLDLQKSSAHRVLRQLVEAGYVRQDPDSGLYASTLKVWELGSAVVATIPIKQAAAGALQELHRATSETVSLTVRDGDDVLYLDKIVSPRPIGFTTRVGSRVPAPLTASGRAMLAYEPDAEAVIERVAARVGPGSLDVRRALADVKRARKDGYLIGRGRVERGVVGIAAAVPGGRQGAVAGLTVSAPVQRLDEGRQAVIVEALLAAAAGLAEAIGQS